MAVHFYIITKVNIVEAFTFHGFASPVDVVTKLVFSFTEPISYDVVCTTYGDMLYIGMGLIHYLIQQRRSFTPAVITPISPKCS